MPRSRGVSWLLAPDSPLPPPTHGHTIGRYFVPYSALQSVEGEPWPTHGPFPKRLRTLLREYEAICDLAGVQFPVRSGYRLYGPHSRGYALDISPVRDFTIPMMAAIARTRRRQSESKLMGIGQNPDWLHIDIRPRTRRINWKVKSSDQAW